MVSFEVLQRFISKREAQVSWQMIVLILVVASIIIGIMIIAASRERMMEIIDALRDLV